MTEGTRRPDRVLSFLSLSLKVPGRQKTLDSRRETLAEVINTHTKHRGAQAPHTSGSCRSTRARVTANTLRCKGMAVRDRLRRPDTKNDKTMTTDPNTRLIDLTVAQLAEIIDKAVEDSLRRRQPQQEDDTPRYVYGIKGIAALFGVSERQARYIKSSGAISKAIRQQGRTIVTDATLALQLFGRRHS